jgi:WD40 repeat protein
LTEASDTVSSLHVHMPSFSIASGSYDGRVRIYDLRMGRTTVDVVAHPVTSVRCSADGNAVLVSSLDGTIRMLDRTDGKLLKSYGGETQVSKFGDKYLNKSLRIRSVFAQADAVVLSGSEAADMDAKTRSQASVFAWDVLSGDIIATIPAGEGVKAVSGVAWNEKGQCWAGACTDGKFASGNEAEGPMLTHVSRHGQGLQLMKQFAMCITYSTGNVGKFLSRLVIVEWHIPASQRDSYLPGLSALIWLPARGLARL